MGKENKIEAPIDMVGDALLLWATLRAVSESVEAHPDIRCGNLLETLNKLTAIAKRIESRLVVGARDVA